MSPDISDIFTLLQVTPRLNDGGVEAITVDVALAAAASGACSLVASHGGTLEGRLIAGGAALVRLPVHARDPLTLAVNGLRLAHLIRRRKVSLVHVRSRAPAFSALWAGHATGVPVIATYHGIYAGTSPLKRWYNGVMTRGDLIIANSAFTRQHILKTHGLDPGRVAIVPEGVDTHRFDPAQVSPERVAAQRRAWGLADQSTTPVVLVAARLTGWKGQSVVIEALGRLAPDRQPLLVLAGRAESARALASLRAAAARAGVEARLRFVGAVDDMPAAYLAADIVAAPSIAPESFGRGVAEACAMERPVLASRLGAVSETLAEGEGGWLVEPGDAAAWARAIHDVLDLPIEARRQRGQRARARIIGHYSLTAMCEATFALYRRVVEARR